MGCVLLLAAAFLMLLPPGPFLPPILTCVFSCWVRLSDRLRAGIRVSKGVAKEERGRTHEKKRPHPSQSHPNGFSDV